MKKVLSAQAVINTCQSCEVLELIQEMYSLCDNSFGWITEIQGMTREEIKANTAYKVRDSFFVDESQFIRISDDDLYQVMLERYVQIQVKMLLADPEYVQRFFANVKREEARIAANPELLDNPGYAEAINLAIRAEAELSKHKIFRPTLA